MNLMTKNIAAEPETEVKELLDQLEANSIEYEVLNNYRANRLAHELRAYYKYAENSVEAVKYYGEFNGDDITCFIVVGDEFDPVAVWAVYGTIDDGISQADCEPGYDLSDKVKRLR